MFNYDASFYLLKIEKIIICIIVLFIVINYSIMSSENILRRGGENSKFFEQIKESKLGSVDQLNQQLYDSLKREIEGLATIMTQINNSESNSSRINYFVVTNSLHKFSKFNIIPIIHCNYDMLSSNQVMPVESAVKVFETTAYGDKILVDLLCEKLRDNYHVTIFNNENYLDKYIIKIEWNIGNTKHKKSSCTII